MAKILAVDDEPHVTRMIKQQLQSKGYAVETASNGFEALQILAKEGDFDAVVTDYNMPKMDGRQLCEAIRQRFPDEKLFIFLVTARLEQPLRDWAEGFNRVEYIEKPLSIRDLQSRLEKIFGGDDDSGE
jgi:CheY-like chemotaxis protein